MRIKYEAPHVEVVEIEIEDVILVDSGDNVTKNPHSNNSAAADIVPAEW